MDKHCSHSAWALLCHSCPTMDGFGMGYVGEKVMVRGDFLEEVVPDLR